MDKTMKSVSIFGLGYVGTVTAACLAKMGSRVVGVDTNAQKVAALESGHAPVLEPGLNELVAEGQRSGLLRATTDPQLAVSQSEISLVCVGTPSLPNGRLDASRVELSCAEIGKALRSKAGFHWIVLRSTVLPGTSQSVAIPAIEAASGKRAGVDFGFCMHPEFTREGCAVDDFMRPAMTILGCDGPAAPSPVLALYEGFPGQLFQTTLAAAEMAKYACNAYHALKVTFANELGTLCRALDVETQSVMEIFLADKRLNISTAYLTPGFAFGGSCLPKDVRALNYRAKQLDMDVPLLRAIMPSNQAHLERAVEAVLAGGRGSVGILGVSFKAGTDDLRESPTVYLIKRLLGEGRQVRIWDPDVALGRLVGSNRQFIEEEIPHIGALLVETLEDVLPRSDVVVIGSKPLDSGAMQSLRPDQVVIDLRSPQMEPAHSNMTVHRELSYPLSQGSQSRLEAAISR
jgi:GDP-mannose 6-dehydrogenase